jgi:uncharacterized membrane protein YdfJ with MMPL/SSD domain
MGARDIVKASSAFKTDETSGLTLPSHVLDEKRDAARKRLRWTWGFWRKWKRLVTDEILPAGVLPFLVCGECMQPLVLVRLDGRTVVDEKIDYKTSDELSLRCNCSDRIMGPSV